MAVLLLNQACEVTRLKLQIRLEILDQILQAYRLQGCDRIQYASLPGQFFFFEKRLIWALRSQFISGRALLHCREMNWKTFQNQQSGLHKIPLGDSWNMLGRVDKGRVRSFIDYRHGEIGLETGLFWNTHLGHNPGELTGAWLDFCGFPDTHRLAITQRALRQSHVAHFTFNLRVRNASDPKLDEMVECGGFDQRVDWLLRQLRSEDRQMVYLIKYHSKGGSYVTVGYANQALDVAPVIHDEVFSTSEDEDVLTFSKRQAADLMLEWGYQTDEVVAITGLPRQNVAAIAAHQTRTINRAKALVMAGEAVA